MRLATVTATVAVATLLLVPGDSAHAAGTQFGNGCVSTVPVGGSTVVMTGSAPTNPLPVAAPGGGIITQIRATLPGGAMGTYPNIVKVLHPDGPANSYTVRAQTDFLPLGAGAQTFAVRMPVAPGDVLGMYGTSSFVCAILGPTDTVGTAPGNTGVGTPSAYSPGSTTALPLVATIEPDADGDGYGDLSQDRCPLSDSLHSACPVAAVDLLLTTRGRAVKAYVATANRATVVLTGAAKVHGGTFTLKPTTQTVDRGTVATLKVKLPKSLKKALTTTTGTVKLRLSVAATDAYGQVATAGATVRLHGTKG